MTDIPNISTESIFKAVRSSGKGGQHVNKVSTKIELYFNINASQLLTEEQKKIIVQKLKNLINDEGVMRIISDEERSQNRNKDRAIEKLQLLIEKALTPIKKRKKTKIPKGIIEKRIREKKVISQIKALRKKPFSDNES